MHERDCGNGDNDRSELDYVNQQWVYLTGYERNIVYNQQ